jgi:Calcineurin-like phosphoesterase
MSKSDFYRLFTGGNGARWEGALESTGEAASDTPAGVPSDSEEVVQLERQAAELREAYKKDPEGVLKALKAAFPPDPDDEDLYRFRIEEALRRTEDLEKTEAEAEAAVALEAASLPENFIDNIAAKYRDPRIQIDPNAYLFEDDSALGIFGWVFFNGLQAATVPRTNGEQDYRKLAEQKGQPFRSHVGTQSGFQYRLDSPPGGQPLRIFLFADFGTGLAHSRYIARQIEIDRPPCAVHLGDVYYTGTLKQYFEYFREPLQKVVESDATKLFVIPDNHEGYSAFEGYVEFLDKNRERFPRTQEQEGSYFSVVSDHVQLLGVDTIWNWTKGRIADAGVLKWLRERAEEGRENGLANVLLTGHHPYEYGKTGTEKLLADVKPILDDDLIDLWFWGNTHYCALFDRSREFPFYGSCIGHGGYPYKRETAGKDTPARLLFLETGSRYEPTGIRSDRGMNGYSVLEVQNDGRLRVKYVDWMGRERHSQLFGRKGADKHLTAL